MIQKKLPRQTLDELQPLKRDFRSVSPLPKPPVVTDTIDEKMFNTRKAIKLDDIIAKYKANGKGFCAALIDSGVAHHKDIDDAITERICCNESEKSKKEEDIYDLLGHGTHIAGLIAGRGESVAGKGVANEAMILSLKVTNGSGGDASWFNIVKAFKEIIKRVKKWNPADPMISVVNLSINGGDNLMRSNLMQSHELVKCIERLNKEYNIPVVVSSGNNFERFRKYGVAYPAYNHNVISVGAVVNFPFEGYVMDTIAPFSQRIPPFTKDAPCFILAPGVFSVSLDIKGGYGYMTGTSLAAPIVTGIILLMQQIAIGSKPKSYKDLPPVAVLMKCLTAGGDEVKNIPHDSTPADKKNVYYDSLVYKRINTVEIIKELIKPQEPKKPK
ncbi:MAG TPA: S8 family serine peptidase [Bacteroidia bacterium]|nr:S8 family serine peptidase [Bacteroidia bacterium]